MTDTPHVQVQCKVLSQNVQQSPYLDKVEPSFLLQCIDQSCQQDQGSILWMLQSGGGSFLHKLSELVARRGQNAECKGLNWFTLPGSIEAWLANKTKELKDLWCMSRASQVYVYSLLFKCTMCHADWDRHVCIEITISHMQFAKTHAVYHHSNCIHYTNMYIIPGTGKNNIVNKKFHENLQRF